MKGTSPDQTYEAVLSPAVPANFLYQSDRPVTDDVVHYVLKYMFGPTQYDVVPSLEQFPPPASPVPDVDLPPPSASERSFLDSMQPRQI